VVVAVSYSNGVQTVERNANIGSEWLLLKKKNFIEIKPIERKKLLVFRLKSLKQWHKVD